ncbi:MAG TPA: hypothetical protein DCF73_12080 [Rhodobiaceae bacterium]|nr:hypothetical protein [Rhodobiaceae bacterium]
MNARFVASFLRRYEEGESRRLRKPIGDIMAAIAPSQPVNGNLPALRRKDEPSHARRTDPAPLAAQQPASTAALSRPPLTTMRPVAAFLAQYVDQHWDRGHSPSQRAEKRQRATSAYIEADMLPDLLAETLRPGRHHKRKL